MASSPPPFPSDDEESKPSEPEFAMATEDTSGAKEDGPPLFSDEPEVEKKLEDVDLNAPTPAAPSTKAEEPEDDLFEDAPSSPPSSLKPDEAKTPEATTEASPEMATAVVADVAATPTKPAGAAQPAGDEAEASEEADKFTMEIKVTDPEKVGDGMGAYMVYQVVTKSDMAAFRSRSVTVRRRFSDFLALQSKLQMTHLKEGRIIPAAPEKSVIGMAKTKFSKEESQRGSASTDFVEKRRAALERYLNRCARHPSLRKDSDFVEFLQSDKELPKASDTSALSGAGMMRLLKGVGDSISKMTAKISDADMWFEEKQQHFDTLDSHLKKLYSGIEGLVSHRRDLVSSTTAFAKSSAMLGNTEEHTSLSRVLAQLSEVEEKLASLHGEQVDHDFFIFGELVKDYIGLIVPVRAAFQQRVKAFQAWQATQASLLKKREQEAKFTAQRNEEKAKLCQEEIKQLEIRVEKGQEEFEKVSTVVRREVDRFEAERVKDFKSGIIQYLEKLMRNQQQLIKLWEGFLPEAKAIA